MTSKIVMTEGLFLIWNAKEIQKAFLHNDIQITKYVLPFLLEPIKINSVLSGLSINLFMNMNI